MSYDKDRVRNSSNKWRVSPCIWLLPPLVASVLVLCCCIKGCLSGESAELYRQSGEVISYLLFLIVYDHMVEFRLFLPRQENEKKQRADARKCLHFSRKCQLVAFGAAALAVFPRLAGTLGMSAYPDWISEMAIAVCAAVTVLGGVPMIQLFLLARKDAPIQDAEQSGKGE